MATGRDEGRERDSEVQSAPTQDEIIEILHGLGEEIGREAARQIGLYMGLLLRWNAKVGLTSDTDPRVILSRHFGESVFGARVAGIKGGRLLDVGSGAGFPAVPIAMVTPELHATLLEPNLKKAAFLRELCRSLGLDQRVGVDRSRLEEYRGGASGFDFVTSRAVKITRDFLEQCAAQLRPGGEVVLWVGLEDVGRLACCSGWVWSEPRAIGESERRVVLWGRRVGK